MTNPVVSSEPFVVAQNPSFRDFINPREVRRMSNIMKRALVTTIQVLRTTGIEQPDAIITGTSIGSLDHTERFLDEMTQSDEQTVSPTWFMQSTHNTVSSTLGIHTHTHGYNTTYSQGGCSFEHTLLDAWMQMQLGRIGNALVGGYDEMVESFCQLLCRRGYVGREGMVPCSEVSMSMLLNTESHAGDLCELAGVALLNRPTTEELMQQVGRLMQQAGLADDDISAVMTGVNGNPVNDRLYALLDGVFVSAPRLHYKHLFGENFTVSALGIYAAAHSLAQGEIPSVLYAGDSQTAAPLRAILFVNAMEDGEYSLTILKKK